MLKTDDFPGRDNKPSSPEKNIQKAILNYLKTLPDGHFVKISQGKYSSRGVADILGCLNGRFVAIEVKAAAGKVTPLQEQFGRQVRDAGGVFLVARSVDEVRRFIEGMG